MNLKRGLCMLAAFAAFLCLLTTAARADDAGVLSETELNTWITQVLRDSSEEKPMNAPVGEESHTEDGYAFLYSFATLYYDKPVLDEKSVLKGISVTGEGYASPRGIMLGSPAQMILDSYGWQNPGLLGDGSFAAFYRLNDLPRAAYWCWAQREGEEIRSVQCAIHVGAGESRYTDAGLVYTLENGAVTGIRAYGLNDFITADDVKSNLNAVMSVEAAGSGDEPEAPATGGEPAAEGYRIKSEQQPFSGNDLKFGGMDYLSLTEAGAKKLFGEPAGEERVKDDTGEVILTVKRDGLILSYTVGADGSRSHLESLSLSKDLLVGPRGIRIGAPLSGVLDAFLSDGEGKVLGGAAVLYGDGKSAPFGLMERTGESTVELRYAATAMQTGEATVVTLNMTFVDEKLTELMIYSW